MKTGRIIQSIGISVANILLLSNCSKTDIETNGKSAIGFKPLITRAAITSLGNGDSFAVWARESSNGTTQTILSQEEIRCINNIWSYDNIRYWKTETTYDFYALYPHDTPSVEFLNSSTGEIPRIAVTNFDLRNSVDLMTAEQTNVIYTGSPAQVVFTFRHLLSKIEIIGRIDPALEASGGSVQIISAVLYGIPATGSCTIDNGTYGTWISGESTTKEDPFCSSEKVFLSGTGISVFGEILPFPQTVSNGFILEIVYEYTDANYTQNLFSKNIRLADAGVTEWNPDTGYRYTFTLGQDYILFETPEVSPWKSASGDIVTVE